MAKTISIQELRPGMMILAILEQNGPVKIRKSGMVTSEAMVQGLAEMGVISLSIDVEQSVDIEPEDEHVSQTQFVLNANAEQPKLDPDSHLSEQFNRSLFLPSLQAVPSAWQYYSKNAAIAFVIAIGGFSSGWLLGNYPNWLPSHDTVTVKDDINEDKVGATQEDLPQQNESELGEVASQSESSSGTVEISDSPSEALVTETVENPGTASEASTTQTQDVAGSNAGEVTLNDAQGQISPELLERFEQAMEELEQESQVDSSESYSIGEDSASDFGASEYESSEPVKRVDQLPARIMTRLPSMSFSAHMYATTPSERWVKVNDLELTEGDWITDDLYIERIEPQHVILNYQGHQFSMRALSEW